MISYDEALAQMIAAGREYSLETEKMPLASIAGRICAADATAPLSNQPFDNSAMDGFVLKAEELAEAANENPVELSVIGRIVAGMAAPSREPARGQCYEIMTGAPLPPGCDAVVPVEKTRMRAGKVIFHSPVVRDDNIRRAGEDFMAGQTVLQRGQELGAQHILPLATLGIANVDVFRRPRVAVISTGREVVSDLEAALEPGQIYNASGPYLCSALPSFGMDVVSFDTVADDPEEFDDKLSIALEGKADVIVSTGAVSAGSCDFVHDVLESRGAEILFHKVKIRPGKPVLFAKFPDGGPFYVGLPGNPVASAAGIRFFLYPLIRAMYGLQAERPQCAILKNNYDKKRGLRFFSRGLLSCTDKAVQEVEIMAKQQSFMVSPFIDANAWVVGPEDVEAMNAGDVVNWYPLTP